MFSTRETGLSPMPRGFDSTIPLMPDCAVPSQYASTSSLVSPASAKASPVAPSSSSSTPMSKCSAKGVQPIPMIATRSLIPCEATSPPSARGTRPQRPGLPEVVVQPVGGGEPAERHLDPITDLHVTRFDVGQLDGEPSTAVEVDDREHDRRAR